MVWGGGGAKGRKTGTFNKPLELTQDVLGAGNLSFFVCQFSHIMQEAARVFNSQPNIQIMNAKVASPFSIHYQENMCTGMNNACACSTGFTVV